MATRVWRSPFVVNQSTTGNQRDPDTAVLGDGRFVITWEDHSGANTVVRWQLYEADGSRIGAEQTIEPGATNDRINPSVAATPEGGFAIALSEVDDPNQVDTEVYLFDDTGVQLATSATNGDSDLSDSPNITAFGSGVAIGSENLPVDGDIEVSTFDTSGGTLAGFAFDSSVNDVTVDRQGQAELTELNNGNLVVSWVDESQFDLKFRILSDVNAYVTGDVTVDFNLPDSINPHDVTALENGGFVVTWYDEPGFPGQLTDISYRVYAPDGTAFTSTQIANAATSSSQASPSVIGLKDGGFGIFYFSNAGGGFGLNTVVRGQLFDGIGGRVGTEFQVGGTDNADGFTIARTIDTDLMEDGRIVVTWGDSVGDGSNSVIQAQIIDPRSAGGNSVMGTGDDDTLHGNAGTDDIFGNDGEDTLFAQAGNDFLSGGEDDDVLYGDAGDDILEGGAGADMLFGGTGDDTASYSGSAIAILATVGGSGVGGDATGDQLREIENLRGSQANDQLRGDTFANRLEGESGVDLLFGNGGDDELFGGAGNDVLNGGLGADLLVGGDGNDRAAYSSDTANLLVTLGGSGAGGSAEGDRLRDIEWLTAGSGNDQLRGDDGNNLMFGQGGVDLLFGDGGADDLRGGDDNDVLVGGAGADALRGDAGVDRVSYSTTSTGITIDLTNTRAATGGDAAGDTFFSIESVTGSTGGDDIRGSNGNDVLNGFLGNDTLNGLQGNDTLIGGGGTDTYEFFSGFGQDRISGFANGTEMVDVSVVVGASAGSLNVSIGGSGNVVADFGTVDTIEFLGITNAALITSADFIFT